MTGSLHHAVAETSYGDMTIIWEAGEPIRVVRILLPSRRAELRKNYPKATESNDEAISALGEDIAGFLDGEDVAFDLSLMDLERARALRSRGASSSPSTGSPGAT